MGYPIKTSDSNWLGKALELYEKRISISIIDDAEYDLDINSDSMKSFKRFTLPYTAFKFLGVFYLLSIVCMALFYYSLSLQYYKFLGIALSIIFLFICAGIPTFYLVKYRAPKIEKTDIGVDIKFSKQTLQIE